MNIHQLSVNYIAEQDRILARVNTTAGEELRLWFTRRLAMGLWPLLNRVVTEHVAKLETMSTQHIAPMATADDQTKQMMAEFKKAESLKQADFKTPFNGKPATLPLGSEPLLVTEVNVTPLATGQLQLNFQEKLPGESKPRSFQMALEQQLIHGFVHLLQKALVQSQWDQGAAPAPVPTQTEEPALAAAQKPRYLN